jgi:hypothetical protein
MIRMTLCPNCNTIQKAGTNCPICKCPVEVGVIKDMGGRKSVLPKHKVEAAIRVRKKGVVVE